ncbi:MAG: ATP-binding protein [Gammaproteobacteria bacterium]
MNKPADGNFSQIRLPGIGPHLVGRSRWAAYPAAALLAVAMALGRFALTPLLGNQAPLLPFVLAVAAAGYLGGRGPALLAMGVSALAAQLLFQDFAGFKYETIAWAGHLTLFALVGAFTAEVIQRLQTAKTALRDSEARLRAILDRASAVVFFKDRDGRYLFVNEEFLRIFAMERSAVIGRTEFELFPREIAAELREHDLQVWRSNASFTTEETVPQTDGPHTYVATKFLLQDRAGAPYAICGIATDITDQKHVQDALRDADKRKDIFLATLSHELRNPLAPIRHAAIVLRTPGVSPNAVRQAREIIERQSLHMSRLLDDLLDVSRITRGSLELRKETLQISSVVETALEAACPHLNARKHTVTVDLPPIPLLVEADAVRLSQVLVNLLTNAARYTQPGGQIRIQAGTEGADVVLRVSDNGIGIGAESLPHVFEMFSQEKSERQHAEGGLGIGLALARGLLELHGGTIEARSEGPGCGSEFIMRVPAGGVGVATQGAPRASPGQGPLNGACKVLVADDNRDAADSLSILLQSDGHEVRKAYDGDGALEAAEVFRPDVALLDIGMPGLSGYEVAERIRAQPWGRDVTLIALTGWGQSQDKQRAVEAGFDHHVTKPVEPERLQALVIARGSPSRPAIEGLLHSS